MFFAGIVVGAILATAAVWRWHDNGWLHSEWYDNELKKLRSDLSAATAQLDKFHEQTVK